MKKSKVAKDSEMLKGCSAIFRFLGIPVSSAQSWARDGMSVRREGRFVTAEVGEREEWLGRESHMPRPAQVVTGKGDLSEAKKESIAVMRKARRRGRSDPDSARNKP